MFRTLATVCLLAGLLVGCAGGSSSDAPAKKAAPAPDRTKVNQAEIDWAGSVIEWAIDFSVPLEAAGSLADEIAATPKIPRVAQFDLQTLFDTILNCGATFRSKVGKPPSARLEEVGRTLEGACVQFAVGADAALEVIDGEPASSRKLLLDEWKNTWTNATDLFKTASGDLVDYQPANAKELPVAEGKTIETRVEPRFGAVASSVVRTDVEARCWSPVDWARLMNEMKDFTAGRITQRNGGFTGFGDQRVNLSPEVCGGLVALAYEGQRPHKGFDRVAIAAGVATLSHEAQHANGVFAEAVAECLGMQGVRAVAEKLGADRAYAQELAATYWQELYPTLPRSYRSPECRDGGRLDQRPASSEWP